MGCRTMFDAVVELAKSMLVLTAATLYRGIIFSVYLSASIGPAVLISFLYRYCTGLEPLPEVINAAICMLFVSLWAEFSVGSEKRIFGNLLERYKETYPATMNFGRFTVHFVLYVFAFFQLYVQFEATHTNSTSHLSKSYLEKKSWIGSLDLGDVNQKEEVVNVTNNSTSFDVEDKAWESHKSNEMPQVLFKLSLAYLVFVTTKNLHRAVLLSIKDLPYNAFYAFNNCMIRLGFAVLNVMANFLYFVPCLLMCVSIRAYKYAGMSTYFQLNFVAALSGMVSSLFELNKPWPQQRGQMPYLYLENNLMSKNIIAHFCLLSILISYYRPFKHATVPLEEFNSSNIDVNVFVLSVAFTVLHITKFGTHAVLSMTENTSLHRIEVVAGDVMDVNSGNFDDASNSSNTSGVYNPCTVPLDTRAEISSQNQLNNNNNTGNDSCVSATPEHELRAEPKEAGGQVSFNLNSKSELLRVLKVIENAVMVQDLFPSQATKESVESSTNIVDTNKNDTILVVELDGVTPIACDNTTKSNPVDNNNTVNQDIESGQVMQIPPVQPTE